MAHDYAYPSSLVVDVERIRVRVERDIVAMLQRAPVFDLFARGHTGIAAEPLRRELLARGLRLTDSMAPELHEAARLAASRLGVTTPCEIYQSTAASENAAIHLVETPVLLEVQGRLLAGLDAGTRLTVLGHELGHYLAHGPWTPVGRVHLAARQLALQEDADAGLLRAASVLWMAGELTADRFGLLACRDLDAALRLEMMAATGLSGDALTWDTNAYLAQVKELVESCLAAGDGARGLTHPEHGLRAYAAASATSRRAMGSSRTRPGGGSSPALCSDPPARRLSIRRTGAAARPACTCGRRLRPARWAPRAHALPCSGATGESMLGYEVSRDEAHADTESPSFRARAPRRGDHREAA